MGGFSWVLAASPDFLRVLSDLLVCVPAAFLAIYPVFDRIRVSPRVLAVELTASAMLLLAGALVAAGFAIPSNYVLLPLLLLLFALYCQCLDLSLAQKATLFLSVSSLGAFITYAALLADTFVVGATEDLYFTPVGITVQWALWAAACAVFAPLLRKHVPPILASRAVDVRFWNVFWLLPAIIVVAMVYLMPDDASTLLYRRVGVATVMMICILFVLNLLVYWLVYRLVSQAEQVFLATERASAATTQMLTVHHLEDRMDTARRARHDLRQHDHAIAAFLDEGDLAGLRAYLGKHEAYLNEAGPLRVCENAAANAIAVYYWDEALRVGAEVDMQLDIPKDAGVSEGELVVVLGNLLENAVDALKAEGDGSLSVRAWHQVGALFITVDNTASTMPDFKNGGIVSTKHAGLGVGTRSVRAVAEANNGTASFACEDGVFRASVMLAPAAVEG